MWQLEPEPAARPELYTWVTVTRYSGKVYSAQVSEHAVSRWPHAASWVMILKQSETVNPVSSSRPRRSCSLHQHWGWRLPSFNWKTNRHGFQRTTSTHTHTHRYSTGALLWLPPPTANQDHLRWNTRHKDSSVVTQGQVTRANPESRNLALKQDQQHCWIM